MKKQLRQGDVLLISVRTRKEQRGNMKVIAPENARLILARGEATGHHHSIDAACAQLFQVDERMLLVVAEPTTVDNQEHNAVEIVPGEYWVVRQREYTPAAPRRVTD